MKHGIGMSLIASLAFACSTADRAETAGPHWAFADLDGTPRHPLVVDGVANVLIFVTTDCPISNSYAPEIRRLVRDHAAEPVQFFLVHVDPMTSPAIAREHATAYQLPGPVVLDPEHRLVARTGVRYTPEAVVLVAAGQIAYRGRIDDRWADLGTRRPAATQHDLRAALRAVLRGRMPDPKRTEPVGCLLPAR